MNVWRRAASALLVFTTLWAHASPVEAQFGFQKGDHIAIVGNATADRLQHGAWLETYLYAAHPDLNLVVRDLAVPCDEVVLRHRPEGFGSADDWLTKVKADVVFAFFGFNESFRGEAGLAQFTRDLDQFIKETQGKNYSGKGLARLVLFSPLANEKLRDPNFSDPTTNNIRLRRYTEAMAAVARSNNVPFVDLFEPSLKLYAHSKLPLTINGFLLNDTGDQRLWQVVLGVKKNEKLPAQLRAAIVDKNEQWEARYRTIDGNNVFGGRSVLAYAPGKPMIYNRAPEGPYISNFKVMQEEMAQRDVLTENRDHRIWAVARGGDLVVTDTNLPPVTEVPTDLPGDNTNGTHHFLGGEEAISRMTVHSHMKVNLFASEEQFPELVSPVQMAWDTQGRLWVAAWKNYPERTPDSKVGDSLLILEDTHHTGHADKITHYLDNLNAPTGFQFYKQGVLVMEAPDLWYVTPHNPIERVLMGMDSGDSHHTANSLCYEPGGAIYLSDGIFHRSHVETMAGPVRNVDGAVYRFEPNTGKFETYAAYNFMNPHGRVFDYWGNDLITDATGNFSYFGPALSGHLDFPEKHAEMKQFWPHASRPCAGTGLISSRHFPDEFQGDFLDCNVIGFQGIYLVKLTSDGSGLKGERQEDLVSSTDPNFRPCTADIGPDGAIYFADWHKPLIGHMQHHLRDPNREKDHGRIYRITYEGRPLLTAPKIEGQPIRALLELLKMPENGTRELAKIELAKHEASEVIAAVDKWVAHLDPHDTNYDHNLAEALWVHQWHNVVSVPLLEQVLRAEHPEARAAAGRVLCYWRDRVPDALSSFKTLAQDPDPRVRLEAIRAASFINDANAVEAALIAGQQPMDYYLDYTLGETLRQLKPVWWQALREGRAMLGAQRLLGLLSSAELRQLPRTPLVLAALVQRSDATETDRLNALGQLATTNGVTHVAELFALYGDKLDSDPVAAASFARLLLWQHREELKPRRAHLGQLAVSNQFAELRQAAWAASAWADGNFDSVWAQAATSDASLADLLNGIPLINDADFRARAYGRVEPLLNAKIAEPPLVRRAAIHAVVSMSYQSGIVFKLLTELIHNGEEVPAATDGMRVLPRASWPKPEAQAAAMDLLQWAKTIFAPDRSSQDYISTVQMAADLGALLPADRAEEFQSQLNALRVPVFLIRTVREQMRYDTPRLVVQPRKAIEIRFENVDFMPHNIVIVKPGTREKVGLAAGTMKPDQLDEQGRAFIADRPDIIAATQLIEPGEHTVLKFETPAREGVYEYLCTFPGHYQIMRGELIVTKDIAAYLKQHPVPDFIKKSVNLEP